jgi:DNA-binding NarL/FixJ family response regulator
VVPSSVARHRKVNVNHLRILVVDDHHAVRRGLAIYLREACPQAHVDEAQGGRQAICLVAAEPPDVVVMDVVMPDLDGVQATRQIKAQQPGIKVIGLSLNWRQSELALDAGADACFLKGQTPHDLVTIICALTAREDRERDTPPGSAHPDKRTPGLAQSEQGKTIDSSIPIAQEREKGEPT